MTEDDEKIAFLRQVGSLTQEELRQRFPLGLPALKQEGITVRSADFDGVDPSGYALFKSDAERLEMLAKINAPAR